MKRIVVVVCFLFSIDCYSQEDYFPPADGDEWETINPKSLDWGTEKIDMMTILSQRGRIILEKEIHSDNPKVSVNRLPKGVYFVRIGFDNQRIILKKLNIQ